MQPETLELRLEDEQTRQRRSTGARRGWVTRRHRASRRLERAIARVLDRYRELWQGGRSLDDPDGELGEAIDELQAAWDRRAGARFS